LIFFSFDEFAVDESRAGADGRAELRAEQRSTSAST
jgi:hypothetical protein